MAEATIEIHIKKSIIDEITNRIKDPMNGFTDPEEYINYILENILNDLKNETDPMTENVEDELKKLGYI